MHNIMTENVKKKYFDAVWGSFDEMKPVMTSIKSHDMPWLPTVA